MPLCHPLHQLYVKYFFYLLYLQTCSFLMSLGIIETGDCRNRGNCIFLLDPCFFSFQPDSFCIYLFFFSFLAWALSKQGRLQRAHTVSIYPDGSKLVCHWMRDIYILWSCQMAANLCVTKYMHELVVLIVFVK